MYVYIKDIYIEVYIGASWRIGNKMGIQNNK